jgi:hypothetical protein
MGAYLSAHGWRFDRPMKEPGAVYVYHQLTDSGEPIEVFVADERGLDPDNRGRSVMAVVDMVKVFERRNWQAVLADMLATDAPATPRAPVPAA